VPWGWELTYPTSEWVVIFGVPENMESYLQAVGRGERDGSDVLSMLFYRAYHLWRGGLMVSGLVSGSSGPGSSPGRGHCVVFLGKTLYSHSASLHPGV